MKKNTKLIVIIILTIIASINAFYLSYDWLFSVGNTANFYSINANVNGSSFCDINSTFSCSEVLKNPLAQFFGVPFPVPAMVVYPLILLLTVLGFFGKIKNLFKILVFLSLLGLIYNGYYIYQETFNIGAYCPLCLLCTAIIITIGGVSLSEIIKK